MKTKQLNLKFAPLALGIFLLFASYAEAQSINSQRDKPATNGNPDNPNMNPSLYPEKLSTMSDTKNPLLKKKKRGSTEVISGDPSSVVRPRK
ncbi:MAG: hypothetical protein H7328_00515 [Bdellovibrio sp.]|nr:hypothetical protein [Bdellovibrio sp.]